MPNRSPDDVPSSSVLHQRYAPLPPRLPPVELTPGRLAGESFPCYLVAEIGQNHNGDVALARRLIEEAAAAGVDAVKFCKRDLQCELTREAWRRPYDGPHSFGRTYGEHRQFLELPPEVHRELRDLAHSRGLTWFSTVCDLPSLEVLEALEAPFYKIASRDLTNLPLLDAVASVGKPMILSCGMDGLSGIRAALDTVRRRHDRVILLQCTSSYPTPPADVHLRAMDALRRDLHVLTGYSDHSESPAIALAAVARGAVMLEKHVTIDRRLPGRDHAGSLEMAELRRLASDIRIVETALGDEVKQPPPSVQSARLRLARSLVSREAIPRGTRISEHMLCLKSAGPGVGWCERELIVGRVTRQDIPADSPLSPHDVE